jgi:glucose/arabinose dehydrogenase
LAGIRLRLVRGFGFELGRTALARSRFGSLACAALLALGASQPARSQTPAAPPAQPAPGAQAAPAAPAAPQGAPRAGGRPAPTPLGDGPWDLETEEQTIHVTVVTKGLDHPWGMVFLPNGDMLVTERPGRLRVLRDGGLDPTPINGLPAIRAAVIGGLLDIALHPDFEDNRLVYFSYSKPDASEPSLATTAVARARWDGGSALADVEDVFVADSWYSPAIAGENNRCCGQGPADGSYGSRIVFDRAGFLYVTIGDRNWGEKAQDPTSHLGKIVRIRDDGTIPEDNPFAGREGYKADLYTIGHRNPLGLTIHPRTGELWETEFGPRGGDELNHIEAGKNYGWILVTEGAHYNGDPTVLGKNGAPGMVDPVLFWAPSINPGNLAFYNGRRLRAWRGDMLMAAMGRTLLRVRFDSAGKPVHQERMLTELGQRLRDVRVGPDGFIYVLTDETAGAMLRIEPGT